MLLQGRTECLLRYIVLLQDSFCPLNGLFMNKEILIISENIEYFTPLKKELRSREFEIIEASGGTEGFRKFSGHNCSLLLVDVIPPKLDSLIICKMLRLKPVFRDIPIIVTSCKTGENIEVVVDRSGADLFMEKPENSIDLLPEILRFFDRNKK